MCAIIDVAHGWLTDQTYRKSGDYVGDFDSSDAIKHEIRPDLAMFCHQFVEKQADFRRKMQLSTHESPENVQFLTPDRPKSQA